MAQIFSRSANLWFKIAVLALVLGITGFAVFGGMLYRSPFWTRVDAPLSQPVPFSHQHHVDGLGLDCRYCHTSVENNAFAGLPPTQTCMTCHSQIWTNAPILEPVRHSYQENKPLEWTRVHDLPDFVYFNHSIHVQREVGCVTCHGRVDNMPITWKAQHLQMRWCLECHRDPAKYVQDHSEGITNRDGTVSVIGSIPTAALFTNHLQTVEQTITHADSQQLQNCSTCHH